MLEWILALSWLCPQEETREIWRFQGDARAEGFFAIADGILVRSGAQELAFLDASTGAVRWKVAIPGGRYEAHRADKHVILAVPSFDRSRSLKSIDLKTGKEASVSRSRTVVRAAHGLYCADGTRVLKVDPATLKEIAFADVSARFASKSRAEISGEEIDVELDATDDAVLARFAVGSDAGVHAILMSLDLKGNFRWAHEALDPWKGKDIDQYAHAEILSVWRAESTLLVEERVRDTKRIRMLRASDGKRLGEAVVSDSFQWLKGVVVQIQGAPHAAWTDADRVERRLHLWNLKTNKPAKPFRVSGSDEACALLGHAGSVVLFRIGNKTAAAVDVAASNILWSVDAPLGFAHGAVYYTSGNELCRRALERGEAEKLCSILGGAMFLDPDCVIFLRARDASAVWDATAGKLWALPDRVRFAGRQGDGMLAFSSDGLLRKFGPARP